MPIRDKQFSIDSFDELDKIETISLFRFPFVRFSFSHYFRINKTTFILKLHFSITINARSIRPNIETKFSVFLCHSKRHYAYLFKVHCRAERISKKVETDRM